MRHVAKCRIYRPNVALKCRFETNLIKIIFSRGKIFNISPRDYSIFLIQICTRHATQSPTLYMRHSDSVFSIWYSHIHSDISFGYLWYLLLPLSIASVSKMSSINIVLPPIKESLLVPLTRFKCVQLRCCVIKTLI